MFDIRGSVKYVKQTLGNDLIIAEVGSRSGEHALHLLATLPIKQLYMVDAFLPYQDGIYDVPESMQEFYCKELYRKVVIPAFSQATLIQQPSVKASTLFPDGFFDYVYIDACHDYESVKEDLQAWFNKVKKDGVFAGHDFKSFKGVEQAVTEFVNATKLQLQVTPDGDWIIHKKGEK